MKGINYLIFFLLFVSIAINSSAQNKQQIQIINAENLVYTETNGIKAQRLIGDVIFKHQDALMYCDSAYMYTNKNMVDAYGNVRINQGDTLNLYGDRLNYDGDSRKAIVYGDTVKLINRDIILSTGELNYDRSNQTASYYNGGTIESISDSNLLISTIGFYNTVDKSFTFQDSVILYNPEFTIYSDTLKYYTHTEIVNFLGPTNIVGDSNLIYCETGWYKTIEDQSKYFNNAYLISDNRKLEGDTLYYDRNLGYGEANGSIQITDTIQNILINGEHAEIYEKLDSAIVTINPLLTQISEEDSLLLAADTFKIFAVDSDKFMLAYHNVKIFRSDLQGVCDSISYLLSDSTIRLFGDPILWSEENQLTADTIAIFNKNKTIHSIFMDQNAFIISKVDSLKFNQIKGKEMTGFFKDKALSLIQVRGNGQTTYYGQDDAKKFIGINVAESSDIDIRLKDKAINSITFINSADAKMHPMGTLDPEEDLRYKGFKWFIELRPHGKEDLLK